MPLKKKLKSQEENAEKEEETREDSQSESGDEEDDDDDESEDGGDQGEMLQVEFEAREPSGGDLESIKSMLKQKFSSGVVNVDELSRIIVEQGDAIGNVVFQAVDDDEQEPTTTTVTSNQDQDTEIYGLLSGVDLASSRTKEFSSGFVKFLSAKNTQFEETLNSKKVFYVVNERLEWLPDVNI